MATIGELARQISESRRVYDSAFRSLTASSAMDAARKALAERTALEASSIAALSSSLSQISKLDTASSSIRALTKANASIKCMFESTGRMDTAMRSAIESNRRWQEMTKTIALRDEVTALTLKRHTSSMLSASLAAQSKFMQLESHRLGAAVHAAASFQESLRSGLDRFTTTYDRLFDFIGAQPATLAELAPVVTQRPPLEVYREADLLEEITIPEDEQSPSEDEGIGLAPEERPLEDWLHQLDPNLANMLRGARAAIRESNPDRARHVTTSVRELFTHVLHRLAPDDGVRGWNRADNYYQNGRPTRRARLLYINRGINVDPLSEFVDADVDSALTLINALHAGTHGITSRLTDRQLQAMVDRIESLLVFLFRLNASNE